MAWPPPPQTTEPVKALNITSQSRMLRHWSRGAQGSKYVQETILGQLDLGNNSLGQHQAYGVGPDLQNNPEGATRVNMHF